MALAEYLPPGHDVTTSQRLALVQRFTLMASRLLIAEALEDLLLLTRLANQAPLSDAERRPVRRIAYSDPWYGCGSAWDDPRFTSRVLELARGSELVAEIRHESMLATFRGVRSHGVRRIPAAIRRAVRMYAHAPEGPLMPPPTAVPATPMPGPKP